jgi:5-(carboxyamino)imidazole ribonucleotide synthase
MALGRIDMIVPHAVMINILGERTGAADVSGVEEVLKIPGASIYIYGKIETRPERKMGHITVVDSNLETAFTKAQLARSYISI